MWLECNKSFPGYGICNVSCGYTIHPNPICISNCLHAIPVQLIVFERFFCRVSPDLYGYKAISIVLYRKFRRSIFAGLYPSPPGNRALCRSSTSPYYYCETGCLSHASSDKILLRAQE
jgi:hypothetical protein